MTGTIGTVMLAVSNFQSGKTFVYTDQVLLDWATGPYFKKGREREVVKRNVAAWNRMCERMER